ncbi:sugar ABC transporter permease [Haliovirga abyssi]|uniref:ABC transmembrane type-1 domain-containing protein n=1 Tax=Haliovirga abyssi TaxID=2996794 RepID=A0AAU9DU65_9FUSO|nr:carbohydrate ABC transporter permease [Haliovirga abyssi]BDU49441.1 hypothetical protein HLVA_00100 [Haliovirga abyssi]
MANKKYTKKQFIRSLIVVLTSLLIAVLFTGWYSNYAKKTVITSVTKSSEFFSKKIVEDINKKFAKSKRIIFIRAKKIIDPKSLFKYIPEGRSDISKLSVASIAIWSKKDGKIVNEIHTISSLNRKNLYGLRKGETLNKNNVKNYFESKIENSWIENNFDKIQENQFVVENINGFLKNKKRNNLHTVRKFNLKGKDYLLDIQYSKRSIVSNRITKKIQTEVIVIIFIYLLFLLVYSLIMDRNLLMHVLVLYVLVFTTYPLTWVISLTFKSSNSMGGTNLNPIPKNATLDNYKAALLNLKKVKEEGIVLDKNNKLFIGQEVIVDGKGAMIEAKNIKSVYNVFDPNSTNLLKDVKFEVKEKDTKVTYNGKEKIIKQDAYYLRLNKVSELPQDMQIYNVEYYTHINFLFLSGIFNSLFIAILTALIGMILSSAAAYAFSRFRFPGRDGFMMSFLVTQMFPGTMMLIPLYIIFSNLGFINTFKGLIFAYSITALPFNIWNLKGFFDTVPKELEEAALIDGCSASQTFYKIVLPLSLPALAISALFSFMGAWNEYIMAATFMNTESKYTIPVVIKMLVGSNSVNWPMFATMAVLVSIPVVIVFLMSQKYLVGGLTAGGVKG